MENKKSCLKTIKDKLKSLVADFIGDFRNFWHSVNDPKQIRTRIFRRRKTSVRRRLEDAFVAMILCTVLGFFCTVCSYYSKTLPCKIGFVVVGVILIGVAVFYANYREAIAESRSARIRYEQRVSRTLRNIERNLVRFCVSVLRLAIVVVAVSVALQCVPDLDQQVPYVAYAADQIVELFNELVDKAVAYIQTYIA